MTESLNTGDYRACPFCSELIRRRAIKCKHCASEIDPRRVREYGARRNNPWHLIVLGLVLLMTGFVAGYPRIVEHLEERALAEAMQEMGSALPEVAAPEAPPVEEVVVKATPGIDGLQKLNFGEDVELEVGRTYSGSALAELLEANATSTRRPESDIVVEFAGTLYEIRARQPRFVAESRYEILSIQEKR